MSNREKGINTFQRYLSVWVLLCMAIGVLIGHFLPMIPDALFGTTSPVALATTVGVLTEVPVMLMLVRIANKTKERF